MSENTTSTTVRIGAPIIVSLADDLHRKAERCVTHHFGCDCREYSFEVMRERVLNLEAELEEAYRTIRDLKGRKADA